MLPLLTAQKDRHTTAHKTQIPLWARAGGRIEKLYFREARDPQDVETHRMKLLKGTGAGESEMSQRGLQVGWR